MADFVGQMGKGPKKLILFLTFYLPHPGLETERLHQPWATSELLLCCFSTCTKSCWLWQRPLHACT